MKVEFFRLLDDGTWDTFIEELPDFDEERSNVDSDHWFTCWEDVEMADLDEYLRDYCNRVLAGQARNRKAVLIGVYYTNPEEEDHE